MLHFLLPALLPSWRFFDDVGPSPRLEYAQLRYASDEPTSWLAFPTPTPRLGVGSMLLRLGWNVRRNDALFVMSCCERVLLRDSSIARQQIEQRLRQHFLQHPSCGIGPAPLCFVFRIRLVLREGEQLIWHDAYRSAPCALPGACA